MTRSVGSTPISELAPSTPRSGATVTVERSDLDALLGSIAQQGYQVLGPTVHDGAIVYREVRSAADLPIGWGDEQDGGTYRLRRREDVGKMRRLEADAG